MKEVPGYGGSIFATDGGEVFSQRVGRVLKSFMSKKGYLQITLWPGVGRGPSKSMKVHRLVAAAYFGESVLFVNHKNGIKTDNRPENLEYCTPAENVAHARDVLRVSFRFRASLDEFQYLTLISMTNKSNKEMSAHFGIPVNTISTIRGGRGYEQYGLNEWASQVQYLQFGRTGKPRKKKSWGIPELDIVEKSE